MKINNVLIIALTITGFSGYGQTVPFDILDANSGTGKTIEWTTSGYGNGYGHKIYNHDPGGKTLLNFAARNNSTNWTDVLTITSNGRVGIGNTDPSAKFQVDGTSHLFGNVTSSATTWIFNNNSEPDATIWLTKPTSGPPSVGHYYIKAFDWWGAYLHFNGTGDNGNERLNVTVDGKFGVGTDTPSAKLHIYDDQTLGAATSDSKLLLRIAGKTTNTFMQNLWLRRDAAGSDWFTARLHDGLSVDSSYLTPGTNTRTWWERDPYHNIQSWGNANQTYMTLKAGKLGIGTTNMPGNHKLYVDGSAVMEEVKVALSENWADFVFEKDYPLPTLTEVEAHIKENGHLKDIPSEAEVKANGINLGEMDAKLLQKIEELTLYTIAQDKTLKEQQKLIETQQKQFQLLQKQINELKQQTKNN